MKNRILPWSGALALIVVTTLSQTGCVDRKAQAQAKKTEELLSIPSRPVEVQDVESRTLSERIEITGQIVSGEDTVVGAKQPGRLVAVFVKDGDSVEAGQVLAQQDTSTQQIQLQQALAQVSAARAQLAQAQTNARVSPERSRAAVKSAEAGVRQARAQLAKLRAGARTEERAQLQAAVDAARTNLDTIKKDLDRKRSLFEQGVIARQALEAAENAYSSALAQFETALQSLNMAQTGARQEDLVAAEQAVAIAEEQLRGAQAAQRLDAVQNDQVLAARAQLRGAEAQVRLVQQQINEAVLRSPFSGRVSGRPVQVGAVLGPGSPVVRLIGSEGLYFEGEVPESAVSKVRLDSSLEVRLDALPDRVFAGTLRAINPQGTDIGRIFKVRVQLQGPLAEVKAGMFARGSLRIREVQGATVVPASAVIARTNEQFLFVAEGTKARRVVVQVGLRDGPWLQVSGVQVGQKVIVKGQDVVEDGTEIEVTPPASSAPAKAGQ